jgi:hypothetical protein
MTPLQFRAIKRRLRKQRESIQSRWNAARNQVPASSVAEFDKLKAKFLGLVQGSRRTEWSAVARDLVEVRIPGLQELQDRTPNDFTRYAVAFEFYIKLNECSEVIEQMETILEEG